MPIPKPRPDEDHNKFVSRCMGDETMKKDYTDTKQRIAICLGETRKKEDSSLAECVHDHLLAETVSYDDTWNEWTPDIQIQDLLYQGDMSFSEEEKANKKATLNKPFRTPDGPKKFSVYVKNDKGNVVKVNFGDPNMEIKRDDPERRKSYRARHNCDNPGPKWKANYWSCKMWSSPNVSDLL
jgi:hypothetical protein